jgi:hypothetical protein
MPTMIGANLARQKLLNDELVVCLGVNLLRTPNIGAHWVADMAWDRDPE